MATALSTEVGLPRACDRTASWATLDIRVPQELSDRWGYSYSQVRQCSGSGAEVDAPGAHGWEECRWWYQPANFQL